MASLNKVQLIGYLGDAPELRYMPNGEAVASFSLATNERWKTKEGEEKERTEWHRVVMYRKLAEVAAEHFKKGAQLYIEGKLHNRSWEKDGQKHYATDIIADEFKFLDRKDPGETKLANQKPPVQNNGPLDDEVPI